MATEPTALNILVVEDNPDLREAIVDALTCCGHHVSGLDCAEALPGQAALQRLDLAILDLNLPGEDGLVLASRLRQSHPALGIIMLTARVRSEDRARGYAQGADIYLTKPASLAELEQATRALARRLQHSPQPHAQARLDVAGRTLTHPDGTVTALTDHEAALLVAFVRSAQHALENWQIAELLGQTGSHHNKSAIELHIVRLRKKLPAAAEGTSPIQALRSRGYQLCIPIVLQ